MGQAAAKGGAGRMLLIIAIVIALVSVGYAVFRQKDAVAPDAPAGPVEAPPEAGDAVRALQEAVGARPQEPEGWQRLGWAYFDSGRYADAARAYKRATALAPRNATFWSSLGEALVMASARDPMPAEAARAFDKAIAIDPHEPRARYFQAVRRDLAGDHAGAIADWLKLLADTPSGAPWESDLRRTIEQVGKIHHIEVAKRLAAARPAPSLPALPSVATAAIPGPTREQMQSAAAMPKGQQDQMIEGMVGSLEAKLKADPANVDGWIMLMRSRMTLGETGKAAAALRGAVAANPGQAPRIRDEARVLGVPGAG